MRKDEKKKIRLFFLLYIVIIFIIFENSFFNHIKKYHTINKGTIIAEIGKFKVYEMDIKTRLNNLSNQGEQTFKIEELDREIIEGVILEKYINTKIIELFKKNKINDKYEKYLTEEYYNRLIVEKYLKDELFFSITEDETKNKYEELLELLGGKEEREIYHILLSTEEEAKRILNIILNGNRSFETMAREKSLDKISAVRGGNIGYIVKEELIDKNFANLVFLLKIGEISKPIKTSAGWEIVKVKDAREINLKSFDEVKEEMTEILKEEKYNKLIVDFKLDEIRQKINYKIKIKEINEEDNKEDKEIKEGEEEKEKLMSIFEKETNEKKETFNNNNLIKKQITNILLNTIKKNEN